jgi:hypothetical protein
MATAEVGALRVTLATNAGEFSKGLNKAENRMDQFARKAQKLGAAIGAAFAVEKLTGFIRDSISAFATQERAVAAVESRLKATGNAAGFTSKQLQAMASDLQNKSLFGDEEILTKVTQNLLTFGNIQGDVFRRAQAAALDLSTILGTDLLSSTIMFGKALNDPVAGITALSRAGVTFTAQQKEQIKALVETGKTLQAQQVILDEFEKFYAGAAEDAAKTTEGRLKAAGMAFGDAMEHVGEVLARFILPVADWVKDMAIAFQELSPEVKTFVVVAGAIAPALAAAAAASGILAAAFAAVLSPAAAVVVAVSAVAGTIAANWRGITNLASAIGDSFYEIYASAKKWLVDALEPIVQKVRSFIDGIRNTFASLRSALGFDTVNAIVDKGQAELLQNIKGNLSTLAEIWNRGAEEIDNQAPDIAPMIAAPAIQAAEHTKKAATKISEEARKAKQAWETLVNQGVQLADQLRSPFQIMEDQVKALTAAHDAGRISAEQFRDAQTRAALISQNAYAGMASNIASSLEGVFGQSKAFAIAQAIINSYESFTKALATYPPPFSYAAAAASLAAGLAQVANIRKTTKSSGGGGGSGGGASVAATAVAPQAVQINLSGERFGRQQVFDLIDQINAAGRDGKQVITTQARAA